ncbi:hypothetical protein HK101_011639 [Irineochytrium annulatum]|nr:hypothetical protein HK101_011639 [Irineochytrium annulatum]
MMARYVGVTSATGSAGNFGPGGIGSARGGTGGPQMMGYGKGGAGLAPSSGIGVAGPPQPQLYPQQPMFTPTRVLGATTTPTRAALASAASSLSSDSSGGSTAVDGFSNQAAPRQSEGIAGGIVSTKKTPIKQRIINTSSASNLIPQSLNSNFYQESDRSAPSPAPAPVRVRVQLPQKPPPTSAGAESQVNEKAVRKILDLEIANESLLAVNSSLEATIRDQSRRMDEMKRRIAVLSRAVVVGDRLGILSDAVEGVVSGALVGVGRAGGAAGHLSDESDLEIEEIENLDANIVSAVDSWAHAHQTSLPQLDIGKVDPQQIIEEEKEAEIMYKRVCAVICQMMDEGKRALARDCIARPAIENCQ